MSKIEDIETVALTWGRRHRTLDFEPRTLNRQTSFVSESEEQTFEFARELAGTLELPAHILLYGELGAGKTTFTKGLAAGLGLEDVSAVASPTFTLVNQYAGRVPIYHVDLYRIKAGEIADLGLEDMFDEPAAAVVVEWAERLGNFDPGPTLRVSLTYLDANTRQIQLESGADEEV